jgi:hypothetical protein
MNLKAKRPGFRQTGNPSQALKRQHGSFVSERVRNSERTPVRPTQHVSNRGGYPILGERIQGIDFVRKRTSCHLKPRKESRAAVPHQDRSGSIRQQISHARTSDPGALVVEPRLTEGQDNIQILFDQTSPQDFDDTVPRGQRRHPRAPGANSPTGG